jgi:hypothetical protein
MFQAEKTSLFSELTHISHSRKTNWLLKRLFVNFIDVFVTLHRIVLIIFPRGKNFRDKGTGFNLSLAGNKPRPEAPHQAQKD